MVNKIEIISDTEMKIHAFDLSMWLGSFLYLLFCLAFIIFISVNLEKLTLEISALMLAFIIGAYLIFFRDIFINFSKSLKKSNNAITLQNKQIDLYEIAGISVKASSVGINGIIMGYVVNIKLKKGLNRNKALIVVRDKKEALKIAEKVAAFSDMKVVDETVW